MDTDAGAADGPESGAPDPEGSALLLAGDVMTGRGIDQILPDPVEPTLHEPAVRSAREYVALAENANGPIPRRASWDYVWGDLPAELALSPVALRIANLETAVTRAESWLPKGINYRMSPGNLPVLKAIGWDAVTLANNHVLDWGVAGLLDTLVALRAAGIATAGAGRDAQEAWQPAILPLAGDSRLLLFACAHGSAGVPAGWAAAPGRPGVARLADLAEASLEELGARIAAVRRPGDRVIVSIHWGSNWGYEVPPAQRRFARGLVERAAVDLVFGHSSHHPRPFEIHDGRAILYGAGDLLNDYEGIEGYEAFRPELVLAYRVVLDRRNGRLRRFEGIPLRIRRFRLERAEPEAAAWLARTLDRESRPFGTTVRLEGGRLRIEPV